MTHVTHTFYSHVVSGEDFITPSHITTHYTHSIHPYYTRYIHHILSFLSHSFISFKLFFMFFNKKKYFIKLY